MSALESCCLYRASQRTALQLNPCFKFSAKSAFWKIRCIRYSFGIRSKYLAILCVEVFISRFLNVTLTFFLSRWTWGTSCSHLGETSARWLVRVLQESRGARPRNGQAAVFLEQSSASWRRQRCPGVLIAAGRARGRARCRLPAMPFGLKLRRTRRYNVLSKNCFVTRIRLLDSNVIECTLSVESTGQECLEAVAQRLELREVREGPSVTASLGSRLAQLCALESCCSQGWPDTISSWSSDRQTAWKARQGGARGLHPSRLGELCVTGRFLS